MDSTTSHTLIDTLGGMLSGRWSWLLAAVLLLLVLAALVFALRHRPSWLQQGRRRLGAWSLRLLRSLRYLSTRREWRYGSPWALLVGDAGSGKTSVVHSVTTGRRSDLLLREARLAVAESEWAFFDAGVAIDISDLPDAREDEAARHWESVLEDIDAQRPERPLDSVVLTVSAESLLEPPPGGLQALADRSYRRLFELQKRFSFTFPVYVLVTHCDRIPGFDAFWSPHGESRRSELFGWSSPFTLNHRFDAGWIDETFSQLREDLHTAQLDAAAHHDVDDPDAFFLFPQRFSALRQPLRTVLELIFRPAIYHEDFLVRGIYFSGRVGAVNAVETGNSDAPVTDVAFVDDLFNERVFRERNLAHPTSHGLWSRNRLLRRVQIGMLVGTALLLFMLALAGMRLGTQVDSVIVGFNAVRSSEQVLSTGDAGCNRGRVRGIYELLNNLATIDMDWGYALIPASWLDKGVTTAAARETADSVLKDIVFPSLRCRLENEARALVTAALAPPTDDATPGAQVEAAQREVTEYLDRVRALEKALRDYRYVTVASGGDSATLRQSMLDRFSDLAEYAYGEPLPARVRQRQGQQARALSYLQITERPQLPKGFQGRVRERLNERLAQARNVIRARIADGAALAARIEDPSTVIDVRQLAEWLSFAHTDWLSADSTTNPCAGMVSLAQPLIDDLVENFDYPPSLRNGLARFDSDSVSGDAGSRGCFVDSLKAIEDTSIAPYGSVTVRVMDDDGHSHLEIAPWVGPELAGLQALQELSFINIATTGEFTCRSPLSGWDGGRLAEAARYAHEYQAFREQHELPSPQLVDTDEKPLYDRLARRSLNAVLDDRVSRAQTPLTLADTAASIWLSPLSTGDERLGARSRAFALTAPQLQMVLGLYAQFGMDAQAIRACARGFAAGELDAANRLAEASGLYEPETDPAALNVETGTEAPPYFELGSAADTKEYLQQQLQRAQVLAGYTEPFVRFLQGTPQATVSDADSRRGAPFWQGTVNEIERYVQGKDTKGQVAALHTLVQKHLRGIGQDNCAAALAGLPEAAPGQGLFHARYTALTRQATDYCTSGNSALALGDYRTLAKRFNSELAGLFPFGPPGNPDAPLAVTKRFFLDYAAQREALYSKLEGSGPRWQRIHTFIDRLDAAADFFQASLAAGAKSRPLGVNVTFRYLPGESVAGNGGSSQLVSWRFESGDAEASYPNGNAWLNWQFGAPVALHLTWAGLSPYRPDADENQSHMEVSEREATFSADGPWSLLRMIAAHRDTDPAMADPLNEDRVVTTFAVPLKLIRPTGADKAGTATLRLALDLMASDPAGKPGAQVALPSDFPRKAPYLW